MRDHAVRSGLLMVTLLLSGARVNGQQAAAPDTQKHLQSAQAYLESEQYADAARELRAAISLGPPVRGAYGQLGFALFQLHQFPEAERAFAKELETAPPDPYSLYYLGRIRLNANRGREAIPYFEKSLQAGEVLDVRQRLAGSYLAQARLEDAIELLETSVRLRPENGGLHYLLARAYQQKGKPAQSRLEFAAANRWNAKVRTDMELLSRLQSAVAANNQSELGASTRDLANSSDPDILLAAGAVLGRAGRHEQAIPFLKKAIDIQPADAEAHYDLGRAYSMVKDSDRAQPQLEEAVKLKPGFYEAELLLGTLLADAGRSDDAIKHLRAATQVRLDNPRVLLLLGLQYFQQRYYADAIKVLEKAVRLDPGTPDARFLLIQAHYRNLEYERALALALETRDRFPDLALAYFHAGAQFNNFGRLPDAKQQLEIALRKDPGLLEARVMLAEVLFKMGQPEESLSELRKALAEDPKLMQAHAGVGKALIQLKRYPEAAAAMEKAIQLDGNLAPLHLYLSQAYRALGRTQEAQLQAQVFSTLNQERAKLRDQDVERTYSH